MYFLENRLKILLNLTICL